MKHSLKALALAVGCVWAFASLAAEPAEARSRSHTVQSHKHVAHKHRSRKPTKNKPVQDARKLFAAKKLPAHLPAASVGRYDLGCVAGAVGLPADGKFWQVMRPSRNRAWGRQELVDYIEKFSVRAHDAGWNGLLIGDMSMPRGGPMPSGHASHQVGLDVDVWLRPAPDSKLTQEERETLDAYSVLKVDSAELDTNLWTQQHADMVRAAAQDASVARIFVTPAIKKYWCDRKDPRGSDTEWLRRLRPWYGHDDHIHVRLWCPKGDGSCTNQAAPPDGDGCGQELSDWMASTAQEPPNHSGPPDAPSPKNPVPLTSLPNACRAVLNAKP